MNSTITTMNKVSPRRVRLDDAPQVCWCGQDLSYTEPGRCRRCGAASVTHSRLVPLSQAG